MVTTYEAEIHIANTIRLLGHAMSIAMNTAAKICKPGHQPICDNTSKRIASNEKNKKGTKNWKEGGKKDDTRKMRKN